MTTTLPPRLRAWQREGQSLKVFQHRIHAWTFGDPSSETLVLLHGFPTSSFDFHATVARLSARYRIVLHDHLGFGLSDKPVDNAYSLIEQAEVAMEVWRQLGVRRAHLLAHDYGTSVATELLARRERGALPPTLSSVTLCNGSVHLDLARPLLAQRLLKHPQLGPLMARLSSGGTFKSSLRKTLGHIDALPEAELNLLWAALMYKGGSARMAQISSYLDERIRFRHRWIAPLTRLDIPTHILWGRKDPVALPAVARQLAAEIPDARLTWLEDLGHYPMLEDPDRWCSAVMAFLHGVPERGGL